MTHLLVCLLAVVSAAPEMAFRVQLRSLLTTERNHKADAVMATVISTDAFNNDLVEGKVTEMKSANKLHGLLNFTFEAIQHAGPTVPVSSSVTSTANWKGQENVDEEGRITRKGRNLGKAVAGTGAEEEFGIDSARLALKGFGPDQPIGPNDMT